MQKPKETAVSIATQRLLNLSKGLPTNTKENRAIKGAYVHASQIVKEYLEMEKSQLFDAFIAGDERGTKDIPFNCEQYYAQTYTSDPI